MIHGATVPENGLVSERAEPGGSTRPRVGCPSSPTTSPRIPTPTAGPRPSSTRSTTSPSRSWPRARATQAEAATFAKRGQNWQNLFDPATGYLAARTGRRELPGRPGLPTGEPRRPGPGRRAAGLRGGQRHPVHLGRSPEPGRTHRADGRGPGGGRPSSTPSSPSSMPPGSRPTTGPGTSRASGSPSSTTTPGSRGGPSRSCAAS